MCELGFAKLRPGRPIKRFVSSATRLYEQWPEEPFDSSPLGLYVRRWLRCLWEGLRDLMIFLSFRRDVTRPYLQLLTIPTSPLRRLSAATMGLNAFFSGSPRRIFAVSTHNKTLIVLMLLASRFAPPGDPQPYGMQDWLTFP
jgi:hypothetical protein